MSTYQNINLRSGTQSVLLGFFALSTASVSAELLSSPPSKERIFTIQKKGKAETLIVRFVDNKSVNFRLSSINKLTGKTAFIAGIAHIAPEVTDPEIDGDEQGEAYAVDEFFFGGTCGLTIRIDAEKHKIAKVYSSPCLEHAQFKKHGVGFDCREPMHLVK